MPGPKMETCREWLDEELDRCNERAVAIVWGKLFDPDSLGPRCDYHVGLRCAGRSMNELVQMGYAIYDLRPVNYLYE